MNPDLAISKSEFLPTTQNAFMDNLEMSLLSKKNDQEFERVLAK